MNAIQLLRYDAEYAFERLVETLEGVDRSQVWAMLPEAGPDFLHTDGSIQSVVLHIAGGKRMYGSVGFRGSEIRWRDVAAQMDAFEPDWDAAVAYLHASHRYWMDAWAGLTDEELESLRPTPSGGERTAWRIIETVNHHDSYHAGQIALLRYAAGASNTPPPTTGDDIRKYCADLPSW